MSANLRTLVSANKAGDNNIRVKGSRTVKDDQEGNSNHPERYRLTEADESRNHDRDTAEYQRNHQYERRNDNRSSPRERSRDSQSDRRADHECRDRREYGSSSGHSGSRDYQRRSMKVIDQVEETVILTHGQRPIIR